jgi:hypothetical protein
MLSRETTMSDGTRFLAVRVLLAIFVISCAGSGATADDAGWQVRKSSGDVWVTTSVVQQASLTDQAALKPGDTIRTGRNGRVLLVRGEETILVAPNSVIGIPEATQNGMSTTIIQQTGSILLEVEKRNEKHFEVETPYLVAAVKGTQFRVSVNRNDTSVDVLKGVVEVADHKSGQHALVLPGQTAKVSAHGSSGLSLSGSGTLSPILEGKPRASSVEHVLVPREGLTAPRDTSNGHRVRALGNERSALRGGNSASRIAFPLGDVKLNFQKVTKGLARAETATLASERNATDRTVWSSGEVNSGNGVGNAHGQGHGNAFGLGNGNALGLGNGNALGLGNGNALGLGNGLGNGHASGKGKGKI